MSGNSSPTTTPDSWAQVLERRHGWLRAVALTRSGEAAAVDDIMQDVAVAAARGHEGLRDPSRMEAWLYRLTVVAALQYRRRMGRQRKLIGNVAAIEQPDELATDPDPLDWLTSREQASIIRRAIRKLPPKDAEILLLKYSHDWTYAQLADRLGISTSAVDGRLQRARARMRRELARQAPSVAEV